MDRALHALLRESPGHQGPQLVGDAARVLAVQELLDVVEQVLRRNGMQLPRSRRPAARMSRRKIVDRRP